MTFRDVPEAITCGDTVEEALKYAAEALELALEHYLDERRAIPTPTAKRKGEYIVTLPVSLGLKIALRNEMLVQKVRPADLARRMKVTPQEVNRLTNLRYGSKIDGIAAAAKALNKTLEIRLV